MNIKLVNERVIILEDMPEVVNLSSDGISVTIQNYEEVKNKLILTVEYDNTYSQIKIKEPTFIIPLSLLTKDLVRVSFACNKDFGFTSYVAEPDRFKVKGIVNVRDSDKLVDLLTVLYNKYIELEAKYEALDKIVNEGDLLI